MILASASILGVLALAVATIVSGLVTEGPTPAALYGPAGNSASSLLRWRGIPVEWFGLPWFVMVLVITAFRQQAWRRQADWLFLSSVPVVGFSLWLSLQAATPIVPVAVAALAATIVLMVSARHGSSLLDLPRSLASGAATLFSEIRTRTALVVAVAAVMAFGAAAQNDAQGTTSRENFRAFRNWYLSVTASPVGERSGRPVSVVAITDYACIDCVSQLLGQHGVVDDAVEEFQQAVQFGVTALPVAGECEASHDAGGGDPSHCSAAVAMRLVRQARGDVDSTLLMLRLARLGPELTGADVVTEVDSLGLRTEYERQYASLAAAVNAEAAENRALGLSAPGLTVNGIVMPRATPGFLEWALQIERERTRLNRLK